MIGLLDSLQLAYTKIRLRKFRLIVTTVLCGLTFSGIIAALILSAGAFKSVDSFSKTGLGNRFIVSVGLPPNYTGLQISDNPDVIARATALQNSRIATKKALAKSLGVAYDPTTETPAVQTFGSGANQQQFVNMFSPASQQAADEYITAHPVAGMDALKKIAASYHPKNYYQSQPIMQPNPNGDSLTALQNGKEPVIANNGKQPEWSETGIASFSNLLTHISDTLLQPFLLPGQTLAIGKDGSIPVVVPYSAAQQILNLPTLPSSASADETLTQLRAVRSQIGGHTVQACYRNASSSALLSQAITDQTDIQHNKSDTTYQEPSEVYGIPTQACAAVPIVRDVRTTSEKQADTLQEQFNEASGSTPPAQQMLTFRVVGIVPDEQQGNATKVDQIFSTLFKSTLGSGWFMPESQLSSVSILPGFFPNAEQHMMGTYSTYYVEFNNANDEQHFIADQTCSSSNYAKCLENNKPFAITAFGSNSAALSRLRTDIARALILAGLIATGLAIIFMGGTVGRIIADSRRETAIFRAMGAKRRDIATIYVSYTLLLSLIVAVFSLALGLLLASVVSNHYSPAFTTKALIAYSPKDLNMIATMYHLDIPAIAAVVLCVIAIGILSSIIPLIRNNRRNPIRDMREQ